MGFPKISVFLWGPYNKGYSLCYSGVPLSWELPETFFAECPVTSNIAIA